MTTLQSTPPCSAEVEQWLAAFDVDAGPCQQLSIDDIDVKASRANQARAVPILPDTVERCAQVLRQGVVMPPIVVYRRAGRYVVVDGNHRVAAHTKATRPTICAYVLPETVGSEKVALLTAAANSRNGQPHEPGLENHLAVHLLALGHPTDAVAFALGISAGNVLRAVRLAKASARAASLRVPHFDELAVTTADALASIASDPVFVAAARLVIAQGVAQDVAKTLVRDIRAARSETDQLALIGNTEEEWTARRDSRSKESRRRIKSPQMQVLAAVGAACSLPEASQVLSIFVTDGDRKELRSRLETAWVAIGDLIEALA